MDIQIDINKILDIYKKRVADLEHEIIILTAKCETLENELSKQDDLKEEL